MITVTLYIILGCKLLEGSNFCLIVLFLCPHHLQWLLTYVFNEY